MKQNKVPEYIEIECPDMHCRFSLDAIGVGVLIENYIPGKEKCIKCGRDMIPRFDPTDLLLSELRIPKMD